VTVKELMNRSVATCGPRSGLLGAVRIMQDRDYGFLPVIDSHDHLVGVVTDRDVCLAAGGERPVARLSVGDAMSYPVVACSPEETVERAMASMARHRVRRLPVINAGGRLEGVVSISDVVRAAGRHGAPSAEAIVRAWKDILCPPAREGAAG
jgi:CBS domain-containing protein